MKTLIVLMLLPVSAAFARSNPDTLMMQVPDHSFHRNKQELQRWWLSRPRIDSDGVVIDGVKYFILIVKPDPSIDYKMLKIVSDGRGAGTMPRRFFIPPLPHLEPR